MVIVKVAWPKNRLRPPPLFGNVLPSFSGPLWEYCTGRGKLELTDREDL
jgi:hypothetical protein